MNKQQTALQFSRKKQDWATPSELYKRLDSIFHFTYDPTPLNQPSLREIDGFSDAPMLSAIWTNFPYDYKILPKWIDWAIRQVEDRLCGIAMLLPVRTNTVWWQEKLQPLKPIIIADPAEAFYHNAAVWFIPRKLKFSGYDHDAPFPSMVFFIRKMPIATHDRRVKR